VRFVLALLLLAGAALAWAVHAGRIEVPPHLNPWAPLDLHAEPGLLTRFKLARLSRDDALCREVLATSGFAYEVLPDRTTGDGCGFVNAVRVRATAVKPSAPFSASCRLAVSLALWERHVLQPAAQAHLGAAVARLEHLGSYACRNVGGRAGGRRSRHATADALDVAGVVTADGRRIRVAANWQGDGREARFVRALRDGACRVFDGVLGPDYDAAHADHLHLERGGFRICR